MAKEHKMGGKMGGKSGGSFSKKITGFGAKLGAKSKNSGLEGPFKK